VEHGQVLVLKLGDLVDVVDSDAIGGKQDDVTQKKDLQSKCIY
jgi:hypothetical protein